MIKQIVEKFPQLASRNYRTDVVFLAQAAQQDIPGQYAVWVENLSPVLAQIRFRFQDVNFRFLNVTEIVEEISQRSCQTEEIDLAYLEFGALNTLQQLPIAISDDFDMVYLHLPHGAVEFDQHEWINFNTFLTQIALIDEQ